MASLGRLWLVQLMVAAVAAGVVVWFLHVDWFPVVREAIRQMPGEGEIRKEQLEWPGAKSVLLARNRFLGLSVDLNHSGQIAREAQLQIEFGRKDVRIFSMLGYSVVEYPAGWRMAFNRTELEPWWGAWEPGILAGAAAGTIVGLWLIWQLLATVYCLPVKLITFLENRDLGLGQSWRMAGAALMPGALFFTFGIYAYGLNLVDWMHLGMLGAVHLVIGWIYLVISPWFLPRSRDVAKTKGNPFAEKRKEEHQISKDKRMTKAEGPNPKE